MHEDGASPYVQEDILFPAVMEVGTSTPPDHTVVFVDTTSSHHMVSAKSQFCRKLVNKIHCSVRVKRCLLYTSDAADE